MVADLIDIIERVAPDESSTDRFRLRSPLENDSSR
jgi:hypothetical protein